MEAEILKFDPAAGLEISVTRQKREVSFRAGGKTLLSYRPSTAVNPPGL
jgi:hypothetical protein